MKNREIIYSVMSMADYAEVYALWDGMPGIGLSSADSPEAIARYLEHNPEMSFTARKDGTLLGAVLCGHDGRRGYLQHLAVAPDARHKGIGRTLVDHCLARTGRRRGSPAATSSCTPITSPAWVSGNPPVGFEEATC